MTTWIIPTFHPAFVIARKPAASYHVVLDWQKACRLQRSGKRLLPRTHLLDSTMLLQASDVTALFQWCWEHRMQTSFALDFESTIEAQPRVICLGICPVEEPWDTPFVVPFLLQGGEEYWKDEHERAWVRGLCESFLTEPSIRKGGHNVVGFDTGHAPASGVRCADLYKWSLAWRAWNVVPRGIEWDSMVASHLLAAELPYGLANVASYYTDLGSFKLDVRGDEEEDSGEDVRGRLLDLPSEKVYHYNGCDAWASAVAWRALREQLDAPTRREATPRAYEEMMRMRAAFAQALRC